MRPVQGVQCFLLAVLALGLPACSDDSTGPRAGGSTFEEVLREGGVTERVPSLPPDIVDSAGPDSSGFVCVKRTVTIQQGGEEFPLFNPNASVIYPGSMLQGASLENPTPDVIAVPRAGGIVSIDLLNGSTTARVPVDEVSKSSITQALNDILSDNNGQTGIVPSNFTLELSEIQSEAQLRFRLGFSARAFSFFSVGARLALSSESRFNAVLVKLTQSYYTMSFDIPTSRADLFAPGVTPAQLSQYVYPDNPATYISDVTYGRVFYLLVESSSSAVDIQAALETSFKLSADLGVSSEVDLFAMASLKERRIKMIALGGSVASSFATITELDNLGALVSRLGEGSDIRTGVPLSYVVRNVLDNTIVNVKLNTSYDLAVCTPIAVPSIPNPVIWFRADAGVQRKDTLSTAVVRWGNSFGNGNDAVSETSAGEGRLITFPSGLPALEFAAPPNGSGPAGLGFSGVGFQGTDYTVLAVVREVVTADTQVTGQFLFGRVGVGQVGRALSIGWPGGCSYFPNTNPQKADPRFVAMHAGGFCVDYSTAPRVTALRDSALVERNAFAVFTVRFAQADGWTVYINGEQVAANPTMTTSLTTWNGARIGSSGGTIQIREVIGWAYALTPEQRIAEERRLRLRWGV